MFNCCLFVQPLLPELDPSSLPGAVPGPLCQTRVSNTQLLPVGPSLLHEGRSHVIRPSAVLGHFFVTYWALSFSAACCWPLARRNVTVPTHTQQAPGDKVASLVVALPYCPDSGCRSISEPVPEAERQHKMIDTGWIPCNQRSQNLQGKTIFIFGFCQGIAALFSGLPPTPVSSSGN